MRGRAVVVVLAGLRCDSPCNGCTSTMRAVVSTRAALVTCIYNGLSGTTFGGRLNRDADYRDSLTTIAGARLPITCFVAPECVDAHRRHFSVAAPNVTLEPLALTDVPHSAAIQRIKRAHPDRFTGIEWQERCVEIMWGKLHMLRTVLSRDPGLGRVYWIDAGLANVNIISTKYITAAALEARRLTAVGRAFPSVLFDRIDTFAGDRVLALKCTVPHNRGIPDRYNTRPYASDDALVGGLFGGRRAAVVELCDRFDDKVRTILADERLYFEESILTGIFADAPSLFRCFTFDSWYHEGWAAHDPARVDFSQFFDEMLQTPTGAPAPRLPWEDGPADQRSASTT
jgi:hypothetical protein